MKKIGLICIALVLALGSLGVGYAAWTDTITISGTVTTGDVSWEFNNASLRDEIPPNNPGGDYVGLGDPLADYTTGNGFEGGYWRLDKNVAWGTYLITDNDDGTNHLLEVTLHNTYPSYFNELSFYPKNTGTIPIKIDHILIKDTMNGDVVVGVAGPFFHQFDYDGNGLADFEIRWGNNWGGQLEPGESHLEISFWMHVLQPMPQNLLDDFTFTIEVVAVQWNEYPLPPDWEPNDNNG